jgi:iron-sulfur cluster assembly protein
MNLMASPRAVDELKKVVEARRQQEGPNTVRVMVRSRCHCGAAHFAMGFDQPKQGDNQIDLEGVTVLVDPGSAPYLDNARMDYSDDLMGQGFRIDAPGGRCGCGGHH